MTPVVASLQSQLHATVLTATPGLDGCRLAFVGGTSFDVVADGLSSGEAFLLLQSARAAMWPSRAVDVTQGDD